jgi:hypothetical protein
MFKDMKYGEMLEITFNQVSKMRLLMMVIHLHILSQAWELLVVHIE